MAQRAKARPRREDSFFGLHFDLHPNLEDTELGRLVTPQMVRRIIRATRPDYLQYDCKGHPGVLGYPNSAVSRSAPGIVNDALAIYRQVTAAEGVALYVHFSGIWDKLAGDEHPEWCAVEPDGKPNPDGRMSTFGPYVTQRMIPQMQEVIDRYQVDGFWIDGECWALAVDYGPEPRRRFKELTGRDTPPTQPGEPYWLEWMTLQRDQFFAYLKTYMDAVHEQGQGPGAEGHAGPPPQTPPSPALGPWPSALPGVGPIQLCSNWLYSPMAPEPVRLPVDFISGDYHCTNSVNSARFHGRQMSTVGLPWDLMAWGFVSFRNHGGRTHKTAVMLQQEAAVVLALGGGFQVYFHPDRHGGFADAQVRLMTEVADFCHARRELCFRSTPVPQVALLVDTTSLYLQMPKVFAPWQGEYRALEGALQAILEAGHAADVIADHQLAGQADRWPVIVVPEWAHLPQGVVHELAEYAHRGGSLMLIGAATCRAFAEHLGANLVGPPTEQKANVQVDARMSRTPGSVMAHGLWQDVALIPAAAAKRQPDDTNGHSRAAPLAYRTSGHHEAEGRQIAATLTRLGRGKLAAVYGPVALQHHFQHAPWSRDLFAFLLGKLYRPIVTLGPGAPRCIDLTLREKAGRLVIHLNNVTAMPTAPDASEAGCFFTDHIPPTPPLDLSIRLPRPPRRIRLEPAGKPLRGKWSRGVLRLTVPPVAIHSAIAIER